MTPAASASRTCPECGGACTCGEPAWDTTCPHCLANPAHIDADTPAASVCKHGHDWVGDGGGDARCSECGMVMPDEDERAT